MVDSSRKSRPARGAKKPSRKTARTPKPIKPVEMAKARMYRELIFETAEQLFGSLGYEKTTMQGIAERAGISLKTVYAAFEGKHELYEEIGRVRAQGLVDVAVSSLEGQGPAIERIERTVRAIVDFFLSHPDYLKLHLEQNTAWGLEPSDAYGSLIWKGAVDTIGGVIASGMARGELRQGDPRLLACLIQAALQVQLCWAISHDSPVDSVISDAIEHIRHLLGAA